MRLRARQQPKRPDRGATGAAAAAASVPAVAIGVLLAVIGLAGCDRTPGEAAAGAAAPGRTAPKAQLVEVMPVVREQVSLVRTLTGSVRAERVHRVFTQEEGRLLALPWREGDAVAEGELLMRLDPALLDAQVARAEAVQRDATSHLAQFERLGRSRAVAAEEVRRARTELDVARAELQLLRTRRSFTTERAPFAGVVSERHAERGDFVSKGTHLLTVADPGSLRIDLDVGERLLALVALDMPVAAELDAVRGETLAGRVARIHPTLDARTRQGRVEIVAAAWPRGARAGQLARVTLDASLGAQLTVPPFAVRRDVDGEFVYRLEEAQDDAQTRRVARVGVAVGRRFADRVVVREGLAAGDRVVVRGFMGLRPGRQVRWREVAPASEPPAAPGLPSPPGER